MVRQKPSTISKVAEPGSHEVSQKASRNIPYKLSLINQSSILSTAVNAASEDIFFTAHKTLRVFPRIMNSSSATPLKTEMQERDYGHQSNAPLPQAPHATKLFLAIQPT